ncbi:hypothetical protein FLONG3_448 [Fusarium longipes]|uniref:Uncharacterized protein n=1 Tax=Fusarium longipes TaxID=694270 RepID=A0A395T977_9HYPO|nr:hypothetical protein FLONG3_448 [Fusarium longipes]
MDVSVSEEILKDLHTKEATSLHELSDKLSACGVGKLVDLPQIIVVGEQSAGKSSVLEAISHIRFPVDGGVCTRFATELIFRRATETRIYASVRFADGDKPPRVFQRKKFHEDDLPEIIKEAKEHMGFSQNEKDFSRDVLRLEIEGPNVYPLSLVDLPGLYHTSSHNQSLGGKDTVEKLVENYMRQKNSIILVVVSANANLVSHSALQKAKDIDPQRQRTIGVITKPDLALASNAKEYIMLAKNQESAHKLQLGWHVLRNRGEDEISLENRDKIEESFFKTGAWASVPSQDCGIATFRQKLSGILYQHIRNSLPGVIEDIETKLRARQGELTRLGTPRPDAKAMRSYLLTIASEFQRLARDGCNGRYNDPFFGDLDDEDRKFRALLRNFNRAFDQTLRTKGSTQIIVSSEEDRAEEDKTPEHLSRFLDNYYHEFQDPEKVRIEELSAKLENKAAANQGREFPGSANADLARQLFKHQAAPWKGITEFHINTVVTVAKAFVDELFRHVVGSPQNNPTTEAILAILVDTFFEKKEKLLRDKIDELLWPYLQGHSLPVDIEFYGELSQKSTSRAASQVCKMLKNKHSLSASSPPREGFTVEEITQAMEDDRKSRAGHFGTDKIIDTMLTYYEMSRRTFTDNVINLAIESCLVYSIPEILTPTRVDDMDEATLKELAAERSETTARRHLLNSEIEVLKGGLDTCRKYRPRPATVVPLSYKPIATASPSSKTSNHATRVSVSPNPVVTKSVEPASVTAKANQGSQKPAQSNTAVTNNSMTSGATAKGTMAGNGNISNSGTTVPKSGQKQNGTSSVPNKVPSIFDRPNPSSDSMPFKSGGLFGSPAANATPEQKPLVFGGSSQPTFSAKTWGSGSGGFSPQNPFTYGVGSGSASSNLSGTKDQPIEANSTMTTGQIKELMSRKPYLDCWEGSDQKMIYRMVHICSSDMYKNSSPEELRCQFYNFGSS